MSNYFFDSYAIIKLIDNDKNYLPYKDKSIVTTSLNLMEVYYYFLRKFNKRTAEYWISKLNVELINNIPIDIATQAAEFRLSNKKERLSYIDCLGYIFAKKWKMKFLTGDREFEGKENVEFVK